MIDYGPLLQKACEQLVDNTPQTRAALFRKARHALENQLRDVRPHLTTETIAQELDRFDHMTHTLEAHYTNPHHVPYHSSSPLQPIPPSHSSHDLDQLVATYLHFPYAWRKHVFSMILITSALLITFLLWPLLRRSFGPSPLSQQLSTHSEEKIQDRLYRTPDTLDDFNRLLLSRSDDAHNQSPSDNDIPIAQRAFLLEEDQSSDSVQKNFTPTLGQAVWRLGSSEIQQGEPATPIVETTISIPEKQLIVQMILARNTDLALPASHTLKIIFSSTAPTSSASHTFTQEIRTINLPHFKETKEGRGIPLIGQIVPVLPNIFLIGLSNEGENKIYNVNLLKSPGWVDIPILFKDNRRAVITFEKGLFGQKVIDQALKAWQ